MLIPKRRHVKGCAMYGKSGVDCPSKSKKKCPFIIDYYESGKRRERSLGTNDEETAWKLVQEMVISGDRKAPETAKTVQEAIDLFLEEERKRGVGESTLKSFRKFLCGAPNRKPNPAFSETLVEFASRKGIEY